VATAGLLAQALTATVSRWWAGRQGDRSGHARLLVPALAIASAGLLAMIWLASPVAVIAGMCLFGTGFGICENATFALMIDRMAQSGPDGPGTASALWNLAYDAGYGAGPAVFGLLVNHTGYPAAFALTGALMLAALPAARRERNTSLLQKLLLSAYEAFSPGTDPGGSFIRGLLAWRGPQGTRQGRMFVMAHDTDKPPAAATALLLSRYAATAVSAGRVALGVAALTWPSVPARPWVGASADELGAQVFGRALGARDLALGLGALAALRKASHHGSDPAGPGAASAWLAAGALSDALDVAITATAWPRLPRATRWLVAASAGGAAVAGAAGALAVQFDGSSRQNRTEEAGTRSAVPGLAAGGCLGM
jgi:MFS family permease